MTRETAGRLVAEYCYNKSQAYFHSGAYFTIFDHEARAGLDRMTVENCEDETLQNWQSESPFAGPELDALDGFGRNFFPIAHTHLTSGGATRTGGSKVYEMLPWLELAVRLDPHFIDAYTEADYWLRKHLNATGEAAGFLRRGLLHNPDSYELNFYLGQIIAEQDPVGEKARSLWQHALACWNQQNHNADEPDTFALRQITSHLARLGEQRGNLKEARTLVHCLVGCAGEGQGPRQWLESLNRQLATHP